jgi:hypothetical protein
MVQMKTVKPISLSLLVCALALVGLLLARQTTAGSYSGDKWEYQIVDPGELIIDERLTEEEIKEAERRGIQKARSLEDKINRVGANGWELAVCANNLFIFKRPTR